MAWIQDSFEKRHSDRIVNHSAPLAGMLIKATVDVRV